MLVEDPRAHPAASASAFPRPPVGLITGALVGVSVALALLLLGVRAGVPVVARWDLDVWRVFLTDRRNWLTPEMRLGTLVGSGWVLVPVVFTVGAFWRWRRQSWMPLVTLLGGYAGTAGTIEVVKLLVARARPPVALALAPSHGFSFPSGHSAEAVAVYGGFAALLSLILIRRVAWSLWLVTAAVVVWVASSRLYLGVHWFTDVIAGLLLGAASVLVQLLVLLVLPDPTGRLRALVARFPLPRA